MVSYFSFLDFFFLDSDATALPGKCFHAKDIAVKYLGVTERDRIK